MMLKSWCIVMLLLESNMVRADDLVQFDQQEADHKYQLEQLEEGTLTCIAEEQRLFLRMGLRKRSDLVKMPLRICALTELKFLEDVGKRPEKEAAAYLKVLSEKQLDEVLKEGR